MRDYLEALIEMHKTIREAEPGGVVCMEDFVLRFGRAFTPQRLPDKYPLGTPKNCYSDATALVAASKGELIYCEGYACGVIPVMHAWAVDREGRVVDPTWAACEHNTGKLPGSAYFGVPFVWAFVAETMVRSEHFGVIDNWWERHPLLQPESVAEPDRWLEPLELP